MRVELEEETGGLDLRGGWNGSHDKVWKDSVQRG